MRRVALLGALLLASCGGDSVTELLVVIDSNLAVPGQMDTIRVQVTGAATMTATGELTGPRGRPLPRTVGVVHAGGELGPVEVTVQGLSRGAVVVERRVSTFFRTGKTLVLPVFLTVSCVHISCDGSQTCVDGACGSPVVEVSSLKEYDGTVERIDGGTTSTCTPVTERCNRLDDDCDGEVDNGFDLMTDPINCGACGTACVRPNAEVMCAGGTCSIVGCDDGFDDCDGDAGNGCEQSLDTPENCGACGTSCDLPNATAACAAGACALSACDTGFDDCNTVPADGCETPLDTTTDCGACGTACAFPNATATCGASGCEIGSCDAGFDDCNLDPTDGCETPLNTVTDCGSCGTPCVVPNATGTCATGMCRVMTCDAGFGDCNTNPADGCERALNTMTSCGACGVSCNLANATESCASGMCEIVTCDFGRGDCDGVAANGCEVDTTRDEMNCGMCGTVCAPPDRCRFTGVCS